MMSRTSFFAGAVVVLSLAAGVVTGPNLLNTVQNQSACPFTYYVEWGDTLYRIGIRFNVWWTDIAAANALPDPDRIYAGQRLTIPCAGTTTVTGSTVATGSGTTTATSPTGASSSPISGPPPSGCYVRDGNACYGATTCITTQDWIRGKETCMFLGLGTNDPPPLPPRPIIYGGESMFVDGNYLGGWSSPEIGSNVCGILILRSGEPIVTGVQAVRTEAQMGSIDLAIRQVRDDLRAMSRNCGGGYEFAEYISDYMGARSYQYP
jgi:LysM repeat protein